MSVESAPPAAPPPQSTLQAWSDIWIAAVTQPSVETYEGLANNPDGEPQTAYKWVFVAGLIGGAFTAIIGALLSAVFDLPIGGGATSALGAGVGTPIIGVICAGPIIGALSVVGLAIWSGVSQWIANAFGGTGNYQKLVYTFATFVAPISLVTGIVGAFPVLRLLQFPIIIYQLVLSVIAVKAVNQLEWGQAAISSLALAVVLFVVFLCLTLVLGVALVGALSSLGQ